MRLERKHEKQYDEIRRLSVADSHQYKTADEMLRRCCDRLTHYQTHHTIEIDHEHYHPVIDRSSELWESLYEWLHNHGGVAWLSQEKGWPYAMQKHITYLSLRI
tara:strand:+ start:1917 stop:2228 length:312 start_codon:yes stop_codon:yes gene_type:complete